MKQTATSSQGNVVAHLGHLGTITHQSGTGIGLVNATYSNVPLTTITGNGTGGVATIVISGGTPTVGSVSVTTTGHGYKTGDVLGASVGDTGRNLRFFVNSISTVNSVILNRVQGEFNTSSTLRFVRANGSEGDLNNGTPTAITNTSTVKDGLHIHVSHRNHGMHAVNNKVTISGVVGVSTITSITEEYAHNATSPIKVSSIAFLGDFEGLPVSATNPGYVQIGNEIIKYTSAANNELKGTVTRGIDNTTAETHTVDKTVRKYEGAGVSLRRINTTHDLIAVSYTHLTLPTKA